jgi:hypothetical protein
MGNRFIRNYGFAGLEFHTFTLLLVVLVIVFTHTTSNAQVPAELISINRAGTATGDNASYLRAVSANGRWVVFVSAASDLTNISDNNNRGDDFAHDVFAHDRWTGVTRLVSVNSSGTSSGNGNSMAPAISADGRYVVFQSRSSDLAAGVTSREYTNIFLRDLQTNSTTLVSTNYSGTGSGNLQSSNPTISDDGRFVMFSSYANDIAPNDTNFSTDVFKRDLQTGQTTLVSVNSDGSGGGNGFSTNLACTPDGRFVVFASFATNLVSQSDSNDREDLFVRDTLLGTTSLVSVNYNGTAAGNYGTFLKPRITPDGHYVVFMSPSSDLTPIPDNNSAQDIFVRDLQAGSTSLVSVNLAGTGSGDNFSDFPTISSDGHYVSFVSVAGDLVSTSTYSNGNVFLRDLRSNTTQLITINRDGTDSGAGDSYFEQALSADGRYLAFISSAFNLVAQDSVGRNIYIHDVQLNKTKLITKKLDIPSGPLDGFSELVITPGGQFVGYSSANSNLITGDANNEYDVYVSAATDASPIGDPGFFVRQHYRDILSREPDQAGWDYWTNQIAGTSDNQVVPCTDTDRNCMVNRRTNVSAAFYIEQEFQQSGSFVYLLNKASFGVQPTFAQFDTDRGKVLGGAALEASKLSFAEEWVARPSFVAAYPAGLSGAEFIDKIIATVKQGSGVDLSGQRNDLISDYQVYQSRARVLRLVVDSPAFYMPEYNAAFVLMQYFGYLKRNPDQEGYDFWLNVLNNREPNNYRGMVCSFITSTEYQERFSSAVPYSNRDCMQ